MRLGWFFCSLAALVLSSRGEDWPQFRGPQRNGVSKETGWTFQWPESGPKVLWRGKVGLGYSSFVIGNGRAYTAGHDKGKDTVFCFDAATGKEIWKHSYAADLGDKYFQGGTTGTPTLAGGQVYWLSRWGDLFAFSAATGEITWQKKIQQETGAASPDWGFSGAPIVYGNLLILNVGEAGAAVEKDTGKLVWKSGTQKKAGYSTPLLLERPAGPLIILGSEEAYIAVHPESGKEAWRVAWPTRYGVNGADPIIADDKMFLSTGYGQGAALFDLSTTPPKEVWKSKVMRTQLNAAVLHEGHIYGMDGDTGDRAPLKCVKLLTGEEIWSEPNIGTGGLVLADGKLILLSAQGELMVLPADTVGFQPTTRAQVLGGTSWTAPVLAEGRIYCRNSRGDIVCIDVRKSSVADN